MLAAAVELPAHHVHQVEEQQRRAQSIEGAGILRQHDGFLQGLHPFVWSVQPQERGAPDHLRVGEQADGFYLAREARGPLRRVQAFGEPAAGDVKPRERAVKRGHRTPRALRRARSVERR